jgi:hypothetical protein
VLSRLYASVRREVRVVLHNLILRNVVWFECTIILLEIINYRESGPMSMQGLGRDSVLIRTSRANEATFCAQRVQKAIEQGRDKCTILLD